MEGSHILIVGSGSAGKRHLRNLVSLDCEVSAMDPREDRLDQAEEQADGLVERFTELDPAVGAADRFDGAVVASPPVFHVEQASALLEAGVPVLLEKPVSPGLDEAQDLAEIVERADVPLLLGYTYRWWPPMQTLRDRLEEIGTPRHAQLTMSAHLEDWHPWEPLEDFFMSKEELGGGALLDESHWIDVMLWFFGMPEAIHGRVEKISDLDITSDDNVDMLCKYEDGLRVAIHLDLFGRPHEKSVTIRGEDGTLQYLFDPHRIRYANDPEGTWKEESFQVERNDMFLDEAEHFLEVLRGDVDPRCTIQDGVRALACVEAVRESTESGQTVKVERA